MNDFDDRNKLLAEAAQRSRDKAAAETAAQNTPPVQAPAPVEPTLPPVTPVVTPPVEPAKEPPVVVPPAEPDPKITTTEPSATKVEPEVSWDNLAATPASEPEAPLTLETLGSALKIENIKSKADIVAQFNQRDARIKELETAQAAQLSDVDDDLKDLINVAKQKGDWKAYLGTKIIDYSRHDPVALFEQQVEQSPRFKKPDGSIDQDAVDAALAEVPLIVKEAQGNAIKQQLVNASELRRQQILAAAEQKRFEFNKNLSTAVGKIPSIFPKEKVGVTFEPKHSDFLYAGIRDGSLIKKHLGSIDVSGVEPEKLARTLAAAEWLEGISQHQLKQGIIKGKKELLAESQNVQLNTPNVPVNPNQTGDKVETSADKLRKAAAKYSTPGSL